MTQGHVQHYLSSTNKKLWSSSYEVDSIEDETEFTELSAKPNGTTVPGSLLSSQPAFSTREEQELLHNTILQGRQIKRKRDNSRSGTTSAGPPQYIVPEYLLSQQTVLKSTGELMSRALSNKGDRCRKPTASPQSESNALSPSRLESMIPALDQSPLQTLTSPEASDEHMHSISHADQYVPRRPAFAHQTTNAKDLEMNNHEVFTMSQDSFFPTPAMTDPLGDIPTPNLPWDSAMGLSFSLDADMAMASSDATVGDPASVLEEPTSKRRVPDSQSVSNAAVPQPENPVLTGERLSHVLKAVSTAGFSSLDDAVVAYYTEFYEDDERLRQSQRLNRIRRLPVLLKELHLAAQGWGQWQRRSFEEQIIKSAEDIMIAELLAMRNHYYSSPGQQAKAETDIEAELPNMWTLLTSLSTRYHAVASKDRKADAPNAIIKLLDAAIDLGS